MQKRFLCLCLILPLALSLAACGKQADEPEQESQQPVVSEQSSQPADTTPESTQTTTLTQETVKPSPIPFTDVSEDDSYYDVVVWAYKNGIASDAETFGPCKTEHLNITYSCHVVTSLSGFISCY